MLCNTEITETKPDPNQGELQNILIDPNCNYGLVLS